MRKIIRLLIALAAVILMAISGWKLFTIYSGYREADQANNEIIDQYVHVQTIPPAPDATQAPDSETTVPVETAEPTEAPEYAPITPRQLVPLFAWDRVPQKDIVTPR